LRSGTGAGTRIGMGVVVVLVRVVEVCAAGGGF
jgi:hypothetical protein